MHIVIVGAGGIGGYFGARLVAAGERVSFVARGRHAAAIAEQGLRVTSSLGNLAVRPLAMSAEPAQLAPADLVIFAVKWPDADAAAAQLAPLLQAGRALELPWLAAAVVRRSERLGLAAPANRFITAVLQPYAGGPPTL